MLLPSSIQRAEDLVGMAMPTVGLSCAGAGPASAMEPSTMADRVDLSKFMFHSQVLSLSRRVVAVCFLAPVRIGASSGIVVAGEKNERSNTRCGAAVS